MKIGVVTIFPEMLSSITDYGITGRAIRDGLVTVNSYNPRDFSTHKSRKVDDRPYGGGLGMVMQVQPLRDAIAKAVIDLGDNPRIIYLSPQGRVLDHFGVMELSRLESIVLVAGRYAGIDDRLMQLDVHEEWSLGNFVLSGGELAAMVFIDSILRQIPGVLGNIDSVHSDSFFSGLLDCPNYTRPQVVDGVSIPKVLVSGIDKDIDNWRFQQRLWRTWKRRPDLMRALLTKLLEQLFTEDI